MDDKVKEFREYRARMNEKILASNNNTILRRAVEYWELLENTK